MVQHYLDGRSRHDIAAEFRVRTATIWRTPKGESGESRPLTCRRKADR